MMNRRRLRAAAAAATVAAAAFSPGGAASGGRGPAGDGCGGCGRGRGDGHAGYALDDAGLCARVWADAGAVQERGSGRCGAPAWTKLRGRAWPRIEVAAAIESGGATPGPQRHGGALPELALEVGKG